LPYTFDVFLTCFKLPTTNYSSPLSTGILYCLYREWPYQRL